MSWRPIETAPRAVDVLLWTKLGFAMVALRYEEGHRCEDAWLTYDGSEVREPTHWMPLPEPPAGERA